MEESKHPEFLQEDEAHHGMNSLAFLAGTSGIKVELA